jgi:hypothetical protein
MWTFIAIVVTTLLALTLERHGYHRGRRLEKARWEQACSFLPYSQQGMVINHYRRLEFLEDGPGHGVTERQAHR